MGGKLLVRDHQGPDLLVFIFVSDHKMYLS